MTAKDLAAVAPLRQASELLGRNQPAEAIRLLRGVQPQLSKIGDYIAWFLALAHFNLKDYPAVLEDLEPLWAGGPPSPLAGSAAVLAARAHKESGDNVKAAHILRLYYPQLPQPTGDALLAMAYEAGNDPAAAAVYYQQIYYQYPATPEAQQASDALQRLKTTLGDSYPPPSPQAMFTRADRWLRAGDFRRARAEYESIASRLSGFDRDLARVRIGAVEYQSYQTNSAWSYLSSLETGYPEVDAERLYYLAECARRLEKDDELLKFIDRLGEAHPDSPWRLKALVSAANRFLLQNKPEVYDRLYRACYLSFSSDPQAEYCHWKFTWSTYLRQRSEAAELLRAHIVNYPGSEKATSALYFLGRLAEAAKDFGGARAYYEEIVERFPNYYYAGLAAERLAAPECSGARVSEETESLLNRVVWPAPRAAQNFEPTALTSLRIERSRLLAAAGLTEMAEKELRFGARTDAQAQLLALELARQFSSQGSPSQAIRAVKSMVPAYLGLPLDAAPPAFWRLLFPLPWRADLERNARSKGLDPFLVAGLIRQESEFNPQAVSPAHAYGLTQLLPSTGRQLARKIGPKRFRTSLLFRPEVNLRLGTTYLRTVYDEAGAQWEHALASYNAGGSRVQSWLTWAQYSEPAEFVETIPFTETRNYVMAVMRNAQIYRRLYGSEKAAVMAAADGIAEGAQPAPKKGASPPAAKKAVAAKQPATAKPGAVKRTPVLTERKPRAVRRPG